MALATVDAAVPRDDLAVLVVLPVVSWIAREELSGVSAESGAAEAAGEPKDVDGEPYAGGASSPRCYTQG